MKSRQYKNKTENDSTSLCSTFSTNPDWLPAILKEQWGGCCCRSSIFKIFFQDFSLLFTSSESLTPLRGGRSPQDGTQLGNSAQPGISYQAAGFRPVSLLLFAERAFHTHRGPTPLTGTPRLSRVRTSTRLSQEPGLWILAPSLSPLPVC